MSTENEVNESPEEIPATPGATPDGEPESAARSLDMLLDVPLQVTVELGRKKMRIGNLLALAKGSVVELDKVAGEPLDVRVNDQLVARGEAVVVNDKFGVRLTDVVSTKERVRGRGHGAVSRGAFLDVPGCTRSKLTVWKEDKFTVRPASGIKEREKRLAAAIAP